MKSQITAIVLGCLLSCGEDISVTQYDKPANDQSNALTSCVLDLLQNQTGELTLLGHQDDLAYGVNWFGESGRSDILESVGQRPSMTGWDLGNLEHGDTTNLDAVPFSFMAAQIKEGFQRGALSTASWHASHPISGGDSWDVSMDPNLVLHSILPGGVQHETYKKGLDNIIALFKSISPTPLFFRPFHEMNGNWFWWGGADPEIFKTLWWFTFDYFKKADVHNLLWVYSLDSPKNASEILRWYPGNDFVDVIGSDDYKNIESADQHKAFVSSLESTVLFAQSRKKIAALSETGLEGLNQSSWFTDVLLKGLHANDRTRAISWVLLWRNANARLDRPGHFYAPYAGHPSVNDFIRFAEEPSIILENDFRSRLNNCATRTPRFFTKTR